jgi:hypothetical protein
MAQKHAEDRRKEEPGTEVWDSIHRRECREFLTTRLEAYAYQIARMKLLGMSWTYETRRAA